MNITEETKNLARRTIASGQSLRTNLAELMDAEVDTPREAELERAMETLLLTLYQIEKNYVRI